MEATVGDEIPRGVENGKTMGLRIEYWKTSVFLRNPFVLSILRRSLFQIIGVTKIWLHFQYQSGPTRKEKPLRWPETNEGTTL